MPTLARFAYPLAALLLLTLSFSASQEARAQNPGDVLINEFRFRGPAGGADEFIELYNNTDADITVVDRRPPPPGFRSGWAIVYGGTASSGAGILHIIPNGTVIPARGYFLITSFSYSLQSYAAANNSPFSGLTGGSSIDCPDNTGIGLYPGSEASTINLLPAFDRVGFTGPGSGFIEGTNLTPISTTLSAGDQYSHVRKLLSGRPQDTNNNANDFVLVSTSGLVGATPAELGAPGPQNATGPVQRNAVIKASLVDGAQASSAPPNRVRSGQVVPNGAFGTLSIQRRFTNTTTAPITRLRFRITDITTLNSPVASSPQADLRVLSSTGIVTDSTGALVRTVSGLTLEQPPDQPNGGGLNSSLTAIPPGGALDAGASIEVQFLLGVQQEGNFRFFVNVEALPATIVPSSANQSSGLKSAEMKSSKVKH
jgi:hypothetical protein